MLRILIHRDINKLPIGLEKSYSDDIGIDYLLLPAIGKGEKSIVNWLAINSVNASSFKCNHQPNIMTRSGLVCTCKLQDALVCTSHASGKNNFYITTGVIELDGNSPMELRTGGVTTYKNYYEQQ